MATMMEFFRISVKGVQIKGYHHFKIKVPSGTPLVIRKEDNMYDPYALGCFIPAQAELIPEALRDVLLYSKSQRKSYTLRDVQGSQIGRVQYFLNRELHHFLECGKITRIEGTACGEPTASSRPRSDQRFQRNKQAGGGAYIPAKIQIEGSLKYESEVLNRLRTTLAECENGDDMSVEN